MARTDRRSWSGGLSAWLLAGALSCWGCGADSTSPGPAANSGGSGSGSKETGESKIDLSGIDKALTGNIKIDGSSTVYKISQAAAEEFGKAAPEVNIAVKFAGTGGGFKTFVKGELDIADASRPITEKEIAECKKNGVEYIELLVGLDALTVAVNPKADWLDSITVEKLKEIWEPAAKENGKMKWKDFDPAWPDKEIHLFGAGTDSGTWEYFTEAVVGKKGEIRSDYTAAENDNVIIKGIEGDQYALGFVPYAYYAPRMKSLKALTIDYQGKGPVGPSVQTVEDGTYSPLSRPLFIYVNRKSAERPEVKAFVDFYLKNGRAITSLAKYIPFKDDIYQHVSERFAKLQTGTAFEGKAKPGMSIDEILKLELQ